MFFIQCDVKEFHDLRDPMAVESGDSFIDGSQTWIGWLWKRADFSVGLSRYKPGSE